MPAPRSRSVPSWLPWSGLGLVVAAQLFLWSRDRSVDADPGPGAGPRAATYPVESRAVDELATRVAELEAALAGDRRASAPSPDPSREDLGGAASAEDLVERLVALEERLARLEDGSAEEREAEQRRRAGLRALNGAIARGDMLEVQRWVDSGLDLDARDEDRNTPLASAAQAGNLEAIDLLVAHGADLERTSGRRSMTPLLAALDAGQGEAALALMGRGSSIEAVDKNGEGALIWASFNGSVDVVRELVARDSKLDFQAHDGSTALMDAARRGHLAIVRMLLEGGADPNVANQDGETALALAPEKGEQAIVNLLLEYGAR